MHSDSRPPSRRIDLKPDPIAVVPALFAARAVCEVGNADGGEAMKAQGGIHASSLILSLGCFFYLQAAILGLEFNSKRWS
jgi:hypothetical protein